ncbi:MAG: hypothetical protein JXA73_18710 [Acidobacteria bacterium]|nr:hypothetical protein [Acidobacteriota bacterium]
MFKQLKQLWARNKAGANHLDIHGSRVNKHLDAVWQGKSEVHRDYDWIPLYFRYRQPDERDTVDDKTWSDLEMYQVFARIDRTTSVIGRQYLYAALRIYNRPDDAEKRRLHSLYTLFRSDAAFREKIQGALYPLRKNNSAYLTTLLYEELPPKPKYYYLIYLSSGLFFLSLALIAVNSAFFWAAAALAVCNLLINTFYGRTVFHHFNDLASFTTMLRAAGNLARIAPPAEVRELDTLRELKDLAAGLNRKVFWLCLDEAQTNDLAAAFFGFLNIFGLSRLVAFLRTVDDLKRSRKGIRRIFDAIGSLDACIAIASWTRSLPVTAIPSFNSAGTIDVTNMYHPLVENAVGNSFLLKNESALITGSNMAGKTTFIKTVGLNLILARTLFICLAERADLPLCVVRTSIKGEEKVIDGQSYYSREVEQIREFLHCREGRFLFLIDEIFRGTNTIERIAISAATLRYLSRRNMALVTTHDVELQPLLSDCSRLFHFSEQVDGNRYYFDFILRDGPCRAGNAIKLIELKGYPANLVDDARRLATLKGGQSPVSPIRR